MTSRAIRLGLAAAALVLATATPAAALATAAPAVSAFQAESRPAPRQTVTAFSGSPGAASESGVINGTPSTGVVWPLQPRPEVVSGFNPPLSTYGAGHRGADLLGAPDQEVNAAVGGRVTYAGLLAGRGVVVVSHGTTRTTYEPVQATVRRGDMVEAGQRIGTLQTFESHCAPRACLHWGLLEGERYLDPLSLVGGGPVRLLPLDGTLPGPPASPVGSSFGRQPGLRHVGVPGGTPGGDDPW